MIPFVLVLSVTLAADPTPEQRELLKTFRTEFVEITPGTDRFPKTFRLGRSTGAKSEQPAHDVTVAYSFSVGKYEVPQNLWSVVMGNNPSKWKGNRNSVEMLTFDEAQEFCRRATDLMRSAKLIAADDSIRLPTEAEWEYATRAGTATVYSFGDDPRDLGKYAWSTENAKGNDPPVGAKLPNAWGLYDTHGYLWEWCLDTWHADFTGAPTDGSAWTDGADPGRRVARGGSWKDPANHLTSSSRISFPQDARDDALGLRCILAKSAVKKAD